MGNKRKYTFTSRNLPGYQKFEGTKGSSKKGGCGFYIKNSIPYIQRKDLNIIHKSKLSEFETNWIEVINSKNQNIIIGVIYRHPRPRDGEFLNYLKQTLRAIDKEKKKVILTGDFNLNLLKFDKSKEVNEFLNLLTARWFTPYILGPTRLTDFQKPSLIDNIFLNFNDMHCNSGNLLNKISDHLPNFIIVENLNLKTDNKQKIYKRSFENFEEKNFRNDINKLKLKEKIESFNCINNKYKSFHEI